MKRRILCLLLVLALLSGTALAAGGSPYAIKVNRACNTVTVYAQDETGAYTVPVKAMICSTARSGYVTPLGTYSMSDYRTRWCLMLDGSYGQYACSFYGNYMFHSVCYSEKRSDSLLYEEYNDLGGPASMGCVRLQVADAKWIYDNCPAGTTVTVYEDAEDPGPLGKPEKTLAEITAETNNGWDPTDPAEGNPWTADLPPAAETLPYDDLIPGTWYYDGVREALEKGLFQGTGPRSFSPNGFMTRAMLVETLYNHAGRPAVTGTAPFGDVEAGAWYYDAVTWAYGKGYVTGLSEAAFGPKSPLTREQLAVLLWRYAGSPAASGSLRAFSDETQVASYAVTALVWMTSQGYLEGSGGKLTPKTAATRAQTAAILNRMF